MNLRIISLTLSICIFSTMQAQSVFKIINDKTSTEDQKIAFLEKAINDGADISAPNPEHIFRLTPLMLASDLGYLKIVNFLLDHVSTIDATDSQGLTALFYAARKGHLDIVNSLLLNGANVNKITKQGRNILLEILYTYGANKIESKYGPEKFSDNIYAIIDKLTSKGANINQISSPSEQNITPIMRAAFYRDWPVVKLLKRKGANILMQDSNGRRLDYYLPDAKNDPKVYSALSATDKAFVDQLKKEVSDAVSKSMEEDWTLIKNRLEESWVRP